jgi:O-antigen ligase
MIEAHPLFGVGIGQYPQSSGHYSSPALLAIYPRENAHNNFAQVAGELGLIGFAAFLAVLAICFWLPDRSRRRDPVVAAVVAGLAAFIVSWFGGHPLLVPEVAYPFWLTLAIVASARPT